MDLSMEIVAMALSKDEPEINGFLFADPGTEVVLGDSTRFSQILTNLLNNGVKFTSEGDVVLVLVTRFCEEDPSKVIIEGFVRDSGIGVSQEHKVRRDRKAEECRPNYLLNFSGSALQTVHAARRFRHEALWWNRSGKCVLGLLQPRTCLI
jgi:light-regulated signal transduction histidine kinase (bacteriophytochrome)